MGIIGSSFFSKKYDTHPDTFVLIAILGIPAFTLLLAPAAMTRTSVVIVCLLWGLALNSYNLIF